MQQLCDATLCERGHRGLGVFCCLGDDVPNLVIKHAALYALGMVGQAQRHEVITVAPALAQEVALHRVVPSRRHRCMEPQLQQLRKWHGSKQQIRRSAVLTYIRSLMDTQNPRREHAADVEQSCGISQHLPAPHPRVRCVCGPGRVHCLKNPSSELCSLRWRQRRRRHRRQTHNRVMLRSTTQSHGSHILSRHFSPLPNRRPNRRLNHRPNRRPNKIAERETTPDFGTLLC